MPRRFSARARGQRREKMWVTLYGSAIIETTAQASTNSALRAVGQTVGASVPFNFLSQGSSSGTVYATRDFTILALSAYGVASTTNPDPPAGVTAIGVQGMSQQAALGDLPEFGRDNVPGIWPLVAPWIATGVGVGGGGGGTDSAYTFVYTLDTRSKGQRKVKVGQAIYGSTFTVAEASPRVSGFIFVRMLCGL